MTHPIEAAITVGEPNWNPLELAVPDCELETRIRLRVDRHIGEDRQAHLLSVFGNDSDVGAITAAVHEKAAFSLTFPDGTTKDVTLGEHASCYKGAVSLPGRKHPVRHLLAVSQELHTNGSAGRTILLRYRREEAWPRW